MSGFLTAVRGNSLRVLLALALCACLGTISSAEPPRVLSAKTIAGQKAGEEAINSIEQTFCWCPAGSFLMGSPEDEPHRSYDEDQVEVTISHGFWISKYEVTEREYKLIRGRSPRDPQGGDYPSVDMRSGDARDYAKKLTEREHQSGALPEGWIYTLPTEAEWEYACRAGTTTAYSFGNSADKLPESGNFADRQLLSFDDSEFRYADTRLDDGFAKAAPVGSFRPNPWGIHDMHGNVWEWCSDNYAQELTGGTDPQGPEKGDGRGRIIRGGSWLSQAHYCRSAMRKAHHDLNSAPYIGIRIVLKLKPAEAPKKK